MMRVISRRPEFQIGRFRRSSVTALAVSCLAASNRSNSIGGAWVESFTAIAPHHPIVFTTTRIYSGLIVDDDSLDGGVKNLPRIFVDQALSPNAIIPLDASQSNYLNVMRITNTKRWGDLAGSLRIFNGKDGEWLAKLVLMDNSQQDNSASSGKRRRRGGSDASVVECLQSLREQPTRPTISTKICLHMGCLKKPRRKWVLEKVTELGVDEIMALTTEYSSRDAWEEDKHRLQIIEAAEQCERMTLPILGEESWEDLIEKMNDYSRDDETTWLICRERSPDSQPIWKALQEKSRVDLPSASTTRILVGPEGGWSPTELAEFGKLITVKGNIQFVSLGSRVLRAETAAMSAVSVVALFQEQ